MLSERSRATLAPPLVESQYREEYACLLEYVDGHSSFSQSTCQWLPTSCLARQVESDELMKMTRMVMWGMDRPDPTKEAAKDEAGLVRRHARAEGPFGGTSQSSRLRLKGLGYMKINDFQNI